MALSKKRPPLSPSSKNRMLLLAGVLFSGVGFLIAGFYFEALGSWWSAQSWVEVPCSIDRAELKASESSGKRTTYKAEVRYHYEYEGSSYQGDKLSYSRGSDNIGSFQQFAASLLQKHVRSREPFRCYVNPRHPEQSLLFRELRLGGLMLLIIFPLGFPLIGGYAFYEAWRGWRNLKVRMRHPDEPWRWKQEWAGESLKSSNHLKALLLCIVWSGVLILPLVVASFVSGGIIGSSGPLVWLLMILWSIPIVMAIRYQRQHYVVGEISFKPDGWPISQAGGLRGQLMFSRPVSLHRPIEITVACIQEFMRKTRNGDKQTKEILWSVTESIDASRGISDLSGTRFPICVVLPYDAPDTTVDASEIDYVWKLKVHSKEMGGSASIDLPVFNMTINTDGNPSIEEVVAPISVHQVADDTLEENLRAAGLQVSFGPDDLLQSIVCAPGRYRQLIKWLVIFDLIWTGALVFLLKVDPAGVLLPGVWGVSVAAIGLFVLYLVLSRQSATFTPEGVEIESALKGLWQRRKFHPRNTLLNFTSAKGLTHGETIYYKVNFAAMSGLKGKIADAIPSPVTAEALVRRLEKWRTHA